MPRRRHFIIYKFKKNGTVEIPLSKPGKYTIIDEADFERVFKHRWAYTLGGEAHNMEYAFTYIRTKTGSRRCYLHRMVLLAPPDVMVDHKDRNGLNNTRNNLRFSNASSNQANRKSHTSRFKGITWDKATGKWLASIAVNGRHHHIGRFTSPEMAARAYDVKARELHGEFARLNFPDTESGEQSCR